MSPVVKIFRQDGANVWAWWWEKKDFYLDYIFPAVIENIANILGTELPDTKKQDEDIEPDLSYKNRMVPEVPESDKNTQINIRHGQEQDVYKDVSRAKKMEDVEEHLNR